MTLKIAHLADIHIRGLQRHAEHRAAFDEFYKHCKENDVDAIVVAGDVYHTKNLGFTPESVELLAYFFKQASQIAPVHVILGNHDVNLQNTSRVDALSPIINTIDSSNIKFYKYSGNYPLIIKDNKHASLDNKLCFLNVFSCLDENNWKNINAQVNGVNFALFHGSVMGATTDDGWQMDADVMLDYFKGHDFVLLGDIHRRQFLDHEKRIAYPGSFIPHNFSETDEKGFLIWEINSVDDFSAKFIPIQCAVPFITIDWEKNVDYILKKIDLLPDKARYRLRSNQSITQHDVKKIHDVLKNKKLAKDIAYKIDNVINADVVEAAGYSLLKCDLRDVNTHIKLLKGYCGESYFSNDEWVTIENIVEKALINVNVHDDNMQRKIWSLKKLEFDNTFRYGKDNVIDFTNISGITGIFGQNRSGKSSIPGTIMYALFNSTDRGSLKNMHVINSQKGYCRVKATLDINGQEYRVERQSVKNENKKKNDIFAVTNLNFLGVDKDGEVTNDLNGIERKDTENILRKNVGLAEDFLLSTFAASSGRVRLDKFISEGPTIRREILARFMGIDVFEKMFQAIKPTHDLFKGQNSRFEDRNWDEELENLNAEIKVLNQSTKIIDKDYEKIKSEVYALELKLKSLPKNIKKIQRNDLVKQINFTSNQLSEISNSITEYESKKIQFKNKINESQVTCDSYNIDELRLKRTKLKELNDNQKSLITQLTKEEHILNEYDLSIKKLSMVPCGDNYPTCMFIKDSYDNKQKIDDQQERVNVIKNSLSTIEGALKELQELMIDDKLDSYSKLCNDIVKQTSDLSLLNEKIINKRKKRNSLQERLDELNKTLSDYDHFENKELLVELNSKQEKFNALDKERLELAQRRGAIDAKLKNLEKSKQEYEELNVKWKLYKSLGDAWSKNGLPSHVLSSQLKIINDEINKILHGIVDFTLEMVTYNDSNALDVFIDDGFSKRIFELSSGMERMVGSLAIRVALSNISFLPKSDMLIIDEGFGVLDDENIDAVSKLLYGLKKWFRHIIIITHIDALKDVVDNVVEISIGEKGESFIRI